MRHHSTSLVYIFFIRFSLFIFKTEIETLRAATPLQEEMAALRRDLVEKEVLHEGIDQELGI